HRDRREALTPTVGAQIIENRARHTLPVDAGMLVKSLVLGRDEGVANDAGNLVELDDGTTLETDLGDEATVRRVELRCLTRRVLVQDFDGRAATGAANERPTGVEEADR